MIKQGIRKQKVQYQLINVIQEMEPSQGKEQKGMSMYAIIKTQIHHEVRERGNIIIQARYI